MIAYYPEVRVVKQKAEASRIGVFCLCYGGHSLFFVFCSCPGIISLKVPLFKGPFQGSFSVCLQRILRVVVFDLRATHRRIAHMCSLLLARHQLSFAKQINHQSTYRPGVAEQHLLCWSSLLLQAHLTVAFVRLKSYRIYLYRLCLRRVIRKRAYERTPTKS